MTGSAPGGEQAVPEQPTIAETMAAAFDKIEAQAETDEETEAPVSAEGPDDEAAATGDDETTDAEPGEGDADDETTDQGSDDDEGAADDQPLAPPARWSAADKEQFNALPREAQQLVLKRESDIEGYLSQKSQEIAEQKRRYDGLESVIGDRRNAWALSGMTAEQALTQLLAYSDFASSNPGGFIQQLARARGIDLNALASAEADADPNIKALNDRLARIEQQSQVQQRSSHEQQQAAVQSVIDTFRADAKAHPYFDELQGDIQAVIPAVKMSSPGLSHKEVLEAAYEKAVWANPVTRAKKLAEQAKEEDARRREAEKAAAKKAKAASTANVRTKGAMPGGTTPRTLEETMSATYDRMNA